MSNEHAPTGGEGATADGGPFVSEEQTMPTSDLDELFEVLANGQRRQILAYLDGIDDNVAAFSDLIEHVADGSVGESTDARERVAVNLHHNHLPKLSDAGVVEYDVRSETVRYRGGPVVAEWVDIARSYDPDLSRA
jgi:DNA-binding transcriptional ArsR family regulator